MREFLGGFMMRRMPTDTHAMPTSYRQLKRRSRAYAADLEKKNAIPLASAFQLDLDSGMLDLEYENHPNFHLRAQVAGTYAQDGTFMWGWGHPAVPEALQQAAWTVQRYGDRQHIPDLVTRCRRVSDRRVWDFTAITARLARADGIFIGDHGSGNTICLVWYYPGKTGV